MKLVDSPIKSMRTSDGFTCVIRTVSRRGPFATYSDVAKKQACDWLLCFCGNHLFDCTGCPRAFSDYLFFFFSFFPFLFFPFSDRHLMPCGWLAAV